MQTAEPRARTNATRHQISDCLRDRATFSDLCRQCRRSPIDMEQKLEAADVPKPVARTYYGERLWTTADARSIVARFRREGGEQ